MGDKSIKNRDWSGAVGQAMRPLPKGAKKAFLDKRDEELFKSGAGLSAPPKKKKKKLKPFAG